MKKILPLFLTILSAGSLKSQLPVTDSSGQNTIELQAAGISGNIEMNYLRHYLWRGMEFGNNDVAQPELNFQYGKWHTGICANINYVPANLPKEYYSRNAVLDEVDFEIGYTIQPGKFEIENKAMVYFYLYQPGSPSTAEVYNKISYGLRGNFSLFTETSLDIASYPGSLYSNTGFCYSKEFRGNFSAEWSVYAGIANKKFNRNYMMAGNGGLNLLGSQLEISKEWGRFYFTATLEKNNYRAKTIRQVTGLTGTDNFSLAIGYNF